ncbi:MAG: hydroxymethylglutaryl-CoA lyase [Candidatus Dormibacter sp.]
MGAGGVTIVEVGPRDGLQNEAAVVSTATKIELIRRCLAAGVTRVEVASFVSPRHVPQMADAEAVVAGLPRLPGVSFIGLVVNERGLERALAAAVDEVNFVVVATDTFSQRNQGVPTMAAIDSWGRIGSAARAAGLRSSVTIGAAFGCPFEGEVAVERVVEIARRVAETEPDEIALADSIGSGVPTQVADRVAAVREVIGTIPLRCHFHNTRNAGLANAVAAVEIGVQALDASLGGIGGCPFAPAATGNIPTEDLAWMLERMGVPTSLQLESLVDAAHWLGTQLGKQLPALVSRAGIFPPPIVAA